ncbi:glycosyltransferase family 4 protein [Sorangium cellulosum]|uniref:Glycosyl transferase family 1 n=1 Tax=Sorangium cellulosum So0157-2 TaxID=1254432 RepID=S4XMP0_SORCE|nr:glycosyltransferase family 4 protein [Sorangium cellulosum]AGP32990.1 glycosyl transferase family 1 [Sorangium cellulosum So0157-2]
MARGDGDLPGAAAPRPGRVLMTADTQGGVWTYALELAAGLARAGVATALAVMGGPLSPAARAAAAAIPGLELVESAYRLEWMDDPWDDVAAAGDWLLDLEERTRPDVVHLNGYCHAALPFRAPRVVVAHACVLSWWRAVHRRPAPVRHDLYRARVAEGLRAAEAVVAPSAAMLSALAGEYGALGLGRGHVIPHARDRRRFAPAPKERFVFAAGRLWDEAKNLAALEKVAPRLPWPVLVAGSDVAPGGVGRRAGESLCSLGWMNEGELAWWMGRAAIYAFPARYAPFGMSVLEAGLSGCALVLGDLPSLRELWRDAAVYVPADDPGALRGALDQLIQDAARREALGALARRRAVRFSPHAMARRYLEVYAVALAARPEAAARACPPSTPTPCGTPCE